MQVAGFLSCVCIVLHTLSFFDLKCNSSDNDMHTIYHNHFPLSWREMVDASSSGFHPTGVLLLVILVVAG